MARDIESIVGSYDWASYDFGTKGGDPERLKRSLIQMLTSRNEKAAERAYYGGIENEAYVQGSVFEVSVPVAECILEAWDLASTPGRNRGLVALQQIACGADDLGRSTTTAVNFVGRVHDLLRENLDLLYGCLHGPHKGVRWSACQMLPVVEQDRSRLRSEYLRQLEAENDEARRGDLLDELASIG